MDRRNDLSKQEKNREYYLKNKERILAKRKSPKGEVPTPAKKPIKSQPKAPEVDSIGSPKSGVWQNFRRINFERLFLILLIFVTTAFLILETSRYLNETEGGGSGLIKAMIGEGIVIALSWVSFSSLRGRFAKFILLSALILFNVWTLSGSVVSAGETAMRQVATLDPKITELEAALTTKEQLFSDALARNRKTLARKYEEEIDAIRRELHEARAERLKVQSPTLTKLNTVQSVLFRFIVMAANALLVSRLRLPTARDSLLAMGLGLTDLS